MPYSALGRLRDYLAQECLSLKTETSIQIKPLKKSNNGEYSAEKKTRAALKIQETWRKYQFQTGFFRTPYDTYIDMQRDDDKSRILSQVMFGKTLSPHKQTRVPTFLPKNPFTHPEAIYYRTDPTHTITADLESIIPNYEKNPNLKSYNYIPITLSHMIQVRDIIREYAPKYNALVTILERKDSQLAFIKVKKNDERFFLVKKILSRLGLTEPNFSSMIAGFGVKASPWQIALHTKTKETIDTQQTDNTFDLVKKHLPNNLTSLKRSHLITRLASIGNTSDIPTHHLALGLLNLVNGIPNDTDIHKNTIKRISLFINLATTNEYDYDRFAFAMYCIIHEISLLLSKNNLHVTFDDFKKDTIENAIASFGLPELEAKRYIALPANSGTNAMVLAMNMAKAAYQSEETAVRQEGNIYYEFTNLGFENTTQKNSTSNIYIISSGPTVWTGIYPGIDINKLIRSIIKKSGSSELKPTTILVDTTSGLYRNLKIDDDLQHHIVSGKISILVHESHQKFGALHSEQLHYGRIFGIGNTEKYSESLITSFEEKAMTDLAENLDMRIGAYINIHAGKILELIKEAHFRNGKYLRDLFEYFGLQESTIIPHAHSITDKERGLFVYGSRSSSVANIIKKHLEYRGSFGHFNTTWTDCGPYYRISPSASDKIDILIEGAEIYLAVNFNKKQLASILRETVSRMKENQGALPLEEQIMLAGTLQALKNIGYKPTSEKDHAAWEYSLDSNREKCDKLRGRKCFHELLDYNTSKEMLTAKLNYAIEIKENDLSNISRYVHNGADIVSAIGKINSKDSLEVIQCLVKKLDGFNISPNHIPLHRITDQTKKSYLKKAISILELKNACMSYANYLEKTYTEKLKDQHPGNTLSYTKEKLDTVNNLLATLKFSDVEASLNSFKGKFNDMSNALHAFKDDSHNKKFRRIVFAILSGGIYIAIRGAKLGSIHFWKSRRELYLEKASRGVPELYSKPFNKR